MSVLTMIIGCVVHIIPMILWIIVGIHAKMGVIYYVVLGMFSVIDVVHTLITAKENIRHMRHHQEVLK